MSRKYERKCDFCHGHYSGEGERFCSLKCAYMDPSRREKLRQANLGKTYSVISNKKKGRPGETHPFWGKHRPKETRDKIADTRKVNGIAHGILNPNWKGGICSDIGEYRRAYYNKRYKEDLYYRLRITMRNRLRFAIKSNQKKGSAIRDLGCTIPELRVHLEKQFQNGMTWDNWAVDGWHIDHKIPLTFFDLTIRGQLLKAVHYTNLQPMWAGENLSKGGANRTASRFSGTMLTFNL
jgi:hypothetical protein